MARHDHLLVGRTKKLVTKPSLMPERYISLKACLHYGSLCVQDSIFGGSPPPATIDSSATELQLRESQQTRDRVMDQGKQTSSADYHITLSVVYYHR